MNILQHVRLIKVRRLFCTVYLNRLGPNNFHAKQLKFTMPQKYLGKYESIRRKILSETGTLCFTICYYISSSMGRRPRLWDKIE